jgi:hypothetical protein
MIVGRLDEVDKLEGIWGHASSSVTSENPVTVDVTVRRLEESGKLGQVILQQSVRADLPRPDLPHRSGFSCPFSPGDNGGYFVQASVKGSMLPADGPEGIGDSPGIRIVRLAVSDVEFWLRFKGIVIGNDQKPCNGNFGYVGYSSVMLDSEEPPGSQSRVKMWFAGWPGDFMYYAHSPTPFERFQTDFSPILVPSGIMNAPCRYDKLSADSRDEDIPSTRDSLLAADPTVIKVPFPDAVGHRYFMYYNGTSHGSIYNSIFFADSSDGLHWSKKDGTNSGKPIPYPVIQVKYPDKIQRFGGGYGAAIQSVIHVPEGFLAYYLDWTQLGANGLGHLRATYMAPGGWAPMQDSFATNLNIGEFDTRLFVREAGDGNAQNRIILVSAWPGDPPAPREGYLLFCVSEDRLHFSAPARVPMAWLTSSPYHRSVSKPSLLGNEGGWISRQRESAIYLDVGYGYPSDPAIPGVARGKPAYDDSEIGVIKVSIY